MQTEPWASVFRAPLPDGETVWFKACAPHSGFEVPLTASLFARRPATVTEVLAHDLERRWLLMADAGERIAELGNPPERWLDLLPNYARLQVGEMDHADDHLDVGVPDMLLARLPERYDELAAAELPLLSDEIVAIGAFASRFASLCAELESHGIGATVQHDDLHMNNVYVKGGALRVLDWGDASISHPFFSLVRDIPIPDREEPSSAPATRGSGDCATRTWNPGGRDTVRPSIWPCASRGSRARSRGSTSATRSRRRIERSSTQDSR